MKPLASFSMSSILIVGLSGCGSHAYYLTHGTVCVLENKVTVKASVPDANGKLQPGVIMTLEPGTEFKGK